MKPVLLAFTSLLLSALAGGAGAAGTCLTDTSQADFQAAGTIPTNVDTASSSGNVILSTTSGGGGAIDQQNTVYSPDWSETCSWYPDNSHWCGQTFTAGKSGALTQIDVNMICKTCAPSPRVVVSVRATSGGLPTGSDLVSTTFLATSSTQVWYSAIFAAPMNVTAGTQYAIVIRSSTMLTAGQLKLSDSSMSQFVGSDVYAGGALVYSTSSGASWAVDIGPKPSVDAAFKTYIGGGGSSGYVSAGDLVSSAKDSNPGTGTTNWSTLSWTNLAPTGTSLRFQAAASSSAAGPFNFVGPDGTAASYFTTTNASLSQFNGNRYLKYRAYLATNSSASTPTLNDATTCYTTTGSADLSITNTDGATTEMPGTPVTYTITASNPVGSSSVTGATVTDTFAPQTLSACTWTCAGSNGGTCPASGSGNISSLVNLPGGASVSFSATCSIAASATGTLSNTASVAAPASVNDPNTVNNSATDTDTLAGAADLAISNTDGTATANPGGSVTYTITASNPGPSSVTGATVTDTFPPSLTCTWTCSGTGTCATSGSGAISEHVNLPGNSSVTYAAHCSIATSASGTLTNTASISPPAGVNDPNTVNNSASDSDSLVAKTSVRLTVTDNVDVAQLGDTLTYVINIANAGPSDASIASISDPLPVQLSGISWTCGGTPGATCKASAGNNMLNNQTATVPAGGTVTYLYTATVTTANVDQFTNTVTATVSSGDPSPGKSASDTDYLSLVFLNGFEGDQALAMRVTAAGGGDSFTAQLGVDAGLLNRLAAAPVTIARGRSANGRNLFSVQLAYLGSDIIMRTLTSVGDGVFSDVSPWQTINLKQHVIGLSWQSATARGGDGFLNVATGSSQMSVSGRNEKAAVDQLQIAVENAIPWLVPIEP